MGTLILAKKSDGLERLEAIRAPVPTLSRGQQLLVVPAVAAAYAKAAQCAEGERETTYCKTYNDFIYPFPRLMQLAIS